MENKEKQFKLGIYARQSVAKETTGSIDDQILQGIEKAKELNFSYAVYKDEGESAAYDSFDNRPAFTKLLMDIRDGIITAVFVYDESRLSRNKKTYNEITELFIKFNIIIYTKIEGVIDYRDSDQEFISGIKNLFNVKLVKDTSKKIKGVLKNNARAGKAGGGVTLAYGFKRDEDNYMVHEEEEVQVYLKMVEWSLIGYGVAKIASLLNMMGVQTKGRKLYKNGLKVKNKYTQEIKTVAQNEILWAPNTILSILKNPIYKGERQFKGETFSVPAIINGGKWNDIQIGLQRNRIHSSRNNKKHLYLLKGLLRCHVCGRNLYGYIKEKPGKEQAVYQCSSKRIKGRFCGMRSVNIQKLDTVIWGLISDSDFFIKKIVSEFQRNDTVIQISNLENQIEGLQKVINLLEEKRKRRIDLYESGGLDRPEYDKREIEYHNNKINWSRDLEELIEKRNFLGNSKFQEQKLIEFAKKVCDNINRYSKLERIILLKELVKNITVNFDEINKRHIINCSLNFETIINTPTEVFLNIDGTSNYNSPKYNEHTFNDKFNPRPHMLIEKYKKDGVRSLKEFHGNHFIATLQHQKWYDVANETDE